MNIEETVTSLDIEELQKLLELSQGDKENEAYRGTLGILDHSDLVGLITERARQNPEFREKLIDLLHKDPLFIEKILQSTSEAAQMLLKGEKLDGTAEIVVKTINNSPGLKRSFRRIYYVVRDKERLNHDSDYAAFKKELQSHATDTIVGEEYSMYFIVFFTLYFALFFTSRSAHFNQNGMIDLLANILIATGGGIFAGGVTTGIVGGTFIDQDKIGENVKLVTEAIWQFLLQVDENVAKELSSPEVEDAHKPPVSLLDVLREDKESDQRTLDDEGHISATEA